MNALPSATSLNGLINQVQNAAAKPASGSPWSLFGSFSMASIMIGLVAGLFGSAYFIYGKRQSNFVMLFSGMALWVVPFFVTSAVWLSISCGALVFAPFVIGRYL
jgi:hypothetical protein